MGFDYYLKIDAPVFYEYGKKKKVRWYLNLNKYRNTHFHILADIKAGYTNSIIEALPEDIWLGEPPYTIRIHYYPKSMNAADIDNICVSSKFITDALVKASVFKDDTIKIIRTVSYSYLGVDKANPRFEYYICPFKRSELIVGDKL